MTFRLPLMLLALAPAFAAAADWRVYDEGPALQLAIDAASVWHDKGRVHFVNQERFTERQRSKELAIDYHIRRLEGWAECNRQRYAFVSAGYYRLDGKSVYAQMFPLPEYDWAWQDVDRGSVAAAMFAEVCRLARTAHSKKTP